MIYFFEGNADKVFAVQVTKTLSDADLSKLMWLFGGAKLHDQPFISGTFIGPRAAMATPWSTNAVEITQNMAIVGISRIEEYTKSEDNNASFDPMLSQRYPQLDQNLYKIESIPTPITQITDIATFNATEGLALSDEEIDYLNRLSVRLGRQLTDSEIFGFSQVNSEHCRHKIFNGKFVIDGQEKESSLFQLIKKTSKSNPNSIVSAYKDNVAFLKGPAIKQFAPTRADISDYFQTKYIDSVLSLKAETHNFPTTVEPFNGAATGSGGEIRDRLAGGQGSLPLAGTAVYMTSYSRLEDNRHWEKAFPARNWLYQTPLDILIKASNGASDFGNKFGQPLITGSILTFEHSEYDQNLGYDKVIMQAGGIGYGKVDQSKKLQPHPGDKIIVMGGDNYRIGMGGAAVSSADTGEFGSGIELNAVQRSNPEMQKRVANAIRGMVESDNNHIISIHDHGAGGHLNCLSELVESSGGKIDLDKLPIGDPTLSAKEIIGNESQERMGLVISPSYVDTLQKIADRERAPMYVVGEVSDDHQFTIKSSSTGDIPIDLSLQDMFGSSPATVLHDTTVHREYDDLEYQVEQLDTYLNQVLQLEGVACKDWLTNKVDRCVGGLVAKQQCVGSLQLPLNNCGVMALDYQGKEGLATSIGHSPLTALIDAGAGSRNAIAEALTNILWAPLQDGIQSVSLSANWMWPCKNEGEDARLYQAVQACSDFAIALGINIPTGKDSLSMKQKYPDKDVLAPGTVIISAAAHCNNVRQVIEPVFKNNGALIYYINMSGTSLELGGSSFAQVLNKIGQKTPDINQPDQFVKSFNCIQQLIKDGMIYSGHDIGSGGFITSLLEMCFAENNLGASIDVSTISNKDIIHKLFHENVGIIFQASSEVEEVFDKAQIPFVSLGEVNKSSILSVIDGSEEYNFDIAALRDTWYRTSYLLDQHQSGPQKAKERFENYKHQPLQFQFPTSFNGLKPIIDPTKPRPKAAVIREKGSNSERELANALYTAGFDVKDIHMTDLISGRETLEDVRMIAAVGGFSNSDVLGSAKGWAGAFQYNEKAKKALEQFFARKDTLSLGVCNGCQLFIELGLINPDHIEKPRMDHNQSNKHECTFTSLIIAENPSVMLSSLSGATLGVWASHGEGRFRMPYQEEKYNIVAKYAYADYPACPNGSDFYTAMLCDDTGRHLVMMPHIERSLFQWNWAHYPDGRHDEVSPWIEAFVNARQWIENINISANEG